jgi:hypothetical protein
MAMAFGATLLVTLALHAGSLPDVSVKHSPGVETLSVPMTETDLAGATGGRAAYCDKALVSCIDKCGNWSWLGQFFVGGCSAGCYYAYNDCGN